MTRGDMARPCLEVVLATATPAVGTGLPVLHGEGVEQLFAAATPVPGGTAFQLHDAGAWRLGAATVPVAAGVESATRELYAELFAVLGGRRLARVWHYVPAINAPGPDGLEVYRAFSRGRSLAFETQFGPSFHGAVPAASAVGTDAPWLTVVFAATAEPLRHVENPAQVPAYEYPAQYGPRPPSFARATVVAPVAGPAEVFVSGTAAIRGHATVAPAQTLAQLDCTLANLREISLACGMGPALARGRAQARHFKVYLRQAADLAAVRGVLEQQWLEPADRVSYLRADICRGELNLEIEVTLRGVVLS